MPVFDIVEMYMFALRYFCSIIMASIIFTQKWDWELMLKPCFVGSGVPFQYKEDILSYLILPVWESPC